MNGQNYTPGMMPFSYNKEKEEKTPEKTSRVKTRAKKKELPKTPKLKPKTETIKKSHEYELTQTEKLPYYQSLDGIYESIGNYTAPYFHSTTLALTNDPISEAKLMYSLRDILLIGALTGLSTLMTGDTGSGKTMIANLMSVAMFGNNSYIEKTCTPGTREADFTDINLEAIRSSAEKLSESVEASPVLTLPCVVINELNRMPGQVQNKLIPYFDYSYDYMGAHFKVGTKTKIGNYQYRLVTINEGDKFGGTSAIDDAIRDRLVLEIPMDIFPITRADRYGKRKAKPAPLENIVNNTSFFDSIININEVLKTIPLSVEAADFMSYIEGMNNCVKSNTNSKIGVDISYLTQNLCKGCHNIQKDNHLCNSVLAPSDRAMTHLKTISQAFALLKAYKLYQDISVSRNPSRAEKLIERPVVTTQDVISAAPFLFYSKMNMNRVWIQKHYQGNKWAATQSVMRIAEKRFKKFVSSFDKEMIRKFYDSESLTKVEHEQFVDYAKTHDTWAYKIG